MTQAAGHLQFSRTMRAASLALSYPDDEWFGVLPLCCTPRPRHRPGQAGHRCGGSWQLLQLR
jgi:hypothetical protein